MLWVASAPHQKKKTNLKLSGAFTILEKTISLNWSKQHPKVSLNDDPRVFVSQPFEILPAKAAEYKVGKAKKRFIGVDIGEYGLAWSLIEVDGNKVTQLESSFIADNQQQVLKKDIISWRQSQVRQTFTSMDTKVARLRESLIGSYKNQLESLALSKSATLSFEYEVSGFEAGGNKVAKVYDSIKRGTVYKKDNSPQNSQSWGKKGANNWALETTAAGTSQTCSRCGRWASLAIEDNQTYELESYEDKLLKTGIVDGVVRLLSKQDASTNLRGKDLKGLIYKTMRPNMGGLGIEIVKRKLGVDKFAKLQKEFGQNKSRGNIAIFVCPYTDCHHISDADQQAAFNIAVRGYLKSVNPARAKKSGSEGLSARFLCQEQAKLIFDPILLSVY